LGALLLHLANYKGFVKRYEAKSAFFLHVAPIFHLKKADISNFLFRGICRYSKNMALPSGGGEWQFARFCLKILKPDFEATHLGEEDVRA